MKGILTAGSLLFALILFEVVVRALDLQSWTSPFWTYHEILGWTQMPSRRFSSRTADGDDVTVEINSLGFRDVEHILEKPLGVRRMVAAGDSFSEAIQVDLDQTYWKILEGLLEAESSAPWEAINLGIGDYGTTQAVLALEQYGFDYDPDLVLLQMFPLNDLCNNSIELADLCKSGNDEIRPYFLEEDGRLLETSTQPVRNLLRDHALTFRLLDGYYRYWRHVSDPPMERVLDPERLANLGLGALPPLLYTYVPEERQPEVIRKAWRITEKTLDRLVEGCRERGVGLLVVLAPFEMRLGDRWELFAAGRSPALERDAADDRLEAFLRKRGVPVVALRRVFEERIEEVLPFRGGHFGLGAHRVAAAALQDEIRAELPELRAEDDAGEAD